MNNRTGPVPGLSHPVAVVTAARHVIQVGDEPLVVVSAQNPVAAEVEAELRSARRAHPRPFSSAHEGFAVLKEEIDELWDEVRTKDHSPAAMRQEAVQVAAMALRFIEECCDLSHAPTVEITVVERQLPAIGGAS